MYSCTNNEVVTLLLTADENIDIKQRCVPFGEAAVALALAENSMKQLSNRFFI